MWRPNAQTAYFLYQITKKEATSFSGGERHRQTELPLTRRCGHFATVGW